MKNTEYLSNGMGGIVLPEKEARRILETSPAYEEYLNLTEDYKREIFDIVKGAKGVKITYDPFFKHIFDPVLHGERLSRLLTVIIGQKVTVKQVLPSQSRRLAAEASLIIMDIVVELENGALANVEIQKVGYRFPGQRSACYSSDLIIRQYDRQKSRKKKKFSYRDLQKVYTIVLVENSSAEFHRIPNQYIHRSSQKFDTGLELELLQEYIFIALDIFREITHNIDKELDAWLYFLSSDEPEDIKRVIEAYPAFLELYREIAEFQRRPEELIAMCNETLALWIADNQLQSQDTFDEENTSSSGKELINGEEWNWRSDIHSSKDGTLLEHTITVTLPSGQTTSLTRYQSINNKSGQAQDD